jgi:hypothetical protein
MLTFGIVEQWEKKNRRRTSGVIYPMVVHTLVDTYQGSHPLSTPLRISGRSFCRPEETFEAAYMRTQLSQDRNISRYSFIHYGLWKVGPHHLQPQNTCVL